MPGLTLQQTTGLKLANYMAHPVRIIWPQSDADDENLAAGFQGDASIRHSLSQRQQKLPLPTIVRTPFATRKPKGNVIR